MQEDTLDLITYNPIYWCKLGWERADGKEVYDESLRGEDKYEFEAGESNIIDYLHKTGYSSQTWQNTLN